MIFPHPCLHFSLRLWQDCSGLSEPWMLADGQVRYQNLMCFFMYNALTSPILLKNMTMALGLDEEESLSSSAILPVSVNKHGPEV